MPRNPSELQRLEEERQYAIKLILEPDRTKASKEALLRELRDIERQLGIEGEPYNSSAFGKDYGGNGR
jgi:hypothetical protein